MQPLYTQLTTWFLEFTIPILLTVLIYHLFRGLGLARNHTSAMADSWWSQFTGRLPAAVAHARATITAPFAVDTASDTYTPASLHDVREVAFVLRQRLPQTSSPPFWTRPSTGTAAPSPSAAPSASCRGTCPATRAAASAARSTS